MLNNTYLPNNESDIDKELQSVWDGFKRRWKVGCFILLLSIGLSSLAAFFMKPQYQATGKLLFKINRTSILTGIEENLIGLEALQRDANPIDTEIEVIKSVPIAEHTISVLQDSSLLNSPLLPQQLIKRLEVKLLVGTDVLSITYNSEDPQQGVNIVNQLMKSYLENNITENRNAVLAAQQVVKEQLPKAKARVEAREKSIQKFREKHQILGLEEESSSILTKRDELQQEIENVQVELQEAKSQSIKIQNQLGMNPQQAIALRNISQSPPVQEALSNLSQLQTQVLQQQEIFQDRDPRMINLYEQIESLERLLQKEIDKIPSGDRTFTIRDLQQGDRDAIEQELTTSLAEVEQKIDGLENKLNQLQVIQNKYQQTFNNLPKIENEYRDLQLQLEAAQSNYRALLKSLEEIRLVEQQNINNVRVIESAQLQDSTHKKSSIILIALGTFIGSIFSISAMTVLEINDKSIKSTERLKQILKFPILGIIPTLKDKKESSFLFKEISDNFSAKLLWNSPKQQESYVEQHSFNNNHTKALVKVNSNNKLTNSLSYQSFLLLQARLKVFSEQLSAGKIIVISSAVPQEGKSQVTAKLAQTIAELGQKVLIVDANLKNPSQQLIWNIEQPEASADVALEHKTQYLPVNSIAKNLDLLLTKKITEGVLNTIDFQKMELLLQKLSHNYDYILIDSPSLLDNVNTLNFCELAHGVLLVARLGLLEEQIAQKCQNLLEITEQNVIGIVVNQSDR